MLGHAVAYVLHDEYNCRFAAGVLNQADSVLRGVAAEPGSPIECNSDLARADRYLRVPVPKGTGQKQRDPRQRLTKPELPGVLKTLSRETQST